MQKLTRLSFEESKNRLITRRDSEWVNITRDCEENDLTLGTAHISTFLKIGDNYVSQLLDMLLDTEEKALSSENELLIDDNYFTDLIDELIRLMQAEYKSIRDRAFMRFEMMPKNARNALGLDIDQLMSQKGKLILQRVEVIKDKMKLRMTKPPSNAQTPESQGPAGSDPEAVYRVIHTKIQKTIETENKKILETLDSILDDIHTSPIDNKVRLFLMQNVDFLIEQYKAPQEQKIPGLINASLLYLSSAANKTEVWSQFGPVIVAYFNKFM